ncbi:hypothetical protein [Limnoglobus roseus]|uniref:hypothetical protein n=1 Tax=Limnoglobus roseus TaxID=2598579 RepID=UPI0011EAC621|nr:hypothetical protein [Limnoglobus roseus]
MFVLAQATFNAAVRNGWLPLNDPVFEEKFAMLERHRDFFAGHSPQPRVLLLGSSRSHLGFDARQFGETTHTLAFNFGTPGGGPLTNALYLRRLLAAGVRPDCVLLELHPALMAGELEGHWLGGYRLRPGEPDRLAAFGHDAGGVPHLGWQGWLTAAYAYRLPALNRYAVRWLPCPFGLTLGIDNDAYGFVEGVELPPNEQPTALRRTLIQYAEPLGHDTLNESAERALRDTIAMCRERGIAVTAFITAEATPLRAAYRPDANRAFEEFVNTLGVPVVRSRECVPDEMFSDGHHMMRPGATLFTNELAKAYEATRR